MHVQVVADPFDDSRDGELSLTVGDDGTGEPAVPWDERGKGFVVQERERCVNDVHWVELRHVRRPTRCDAARALHERHCDHGCVHLRLHRIPLVHLVHDYRVVGGRKEEGLRGASATRAVARPPGA